jgi:7,8-dihydropterin-6-yl-methyl-4-(beta-D-ribofuranosyl)aminobenzene 5'-phosphate synthase
MQIKLIAEGSTRWQRFIRRWGISFLIGEDVLFDTFGDAKVFLRNFRKFRIDPSKIKHIVISHDHWDHIAGLWMLLEEHKDIKIYIGKNFSREFKMRLSVFDIEVVEVDGPIVIREGVFSTGQIRGKYAGDDIYEQSLVVKTEKGLTLVTGCSHPNINYIASLVKSQFGTAPSTVIGGLHLKDESFGRVRDAIKKLDSLGVSDIIPLHCSGEKAQTEVKEQFGKKNSLKEGQFLEV